MKLNLKMKQRNRYLLSDRCGFVVDKRREVITMCSLLQISISIVLHMKLSNFPLLYWTRVAFYYEVDIKQTVCLCYGEDIEVTTQIINCQVVNRSLSSLAWYQWFQYDWMTKRSRHFVHRVTHLLCLPLRSLGV